MPVSYIWKALNSRYDSDEPTFMNFEEAKLVCHVTDVGKNGKWGGGGKEEHFRGKGTGEGREINGNGRQMKGWRGHCRRARRFGKWRV